MRKENQLKSNATRSKKSLTLFVAVVLVVTLTVGGTLAYLQTKSDTVANTFRPSEVTCAVTISGSNDTYTGTITNTGDIPAYIRVAVVCTWRDVNDGGVFWQNPSFNVSGTDWDTETNDGFYYYTSEVPVSEERKLTVSTNDTAPDGYNFTVEILAEAIQSVPTNAVTDAWDVTVDTDDGTISK